jgi:dipeptidase
MTCYVPLYCGITALPDSFRLGGPDGGRPGYTRESAWWAFNRVAGLAAHRWGDMRHDVAAVRDPLQAEAFERQSEIERRAAELYAQDPDQAKEYLTRYSMEFAEKAVEAYWRLGDDLWTKYDGRF